MSLAEQLISQMLTEDDASKAKGLAKKHGGSGSLDAGFGDFQFKDEAAAGKFSKAINSMKSEQGLSAGDPEEAKNGKWVITVEPE